MKEDVGAFSKVVEGSYLENLIKDIIDSNTYYRIDL
jgi:hypothetical protein